MCMAMDRTGNTRFTRFTRTPIGSLRRVTLLKHYHRRLRIRGAYKRHAGPAHWRIWCSGCWNWGWWRAVKALGLLSSLGTVSAADSHTTSLAARTVNVIPLRVVSTHSFLSRLLTISQFYQASFVNNLHCGLSGNMALPPGMDLSKIPLMPNPSGAPPDFLSGPTLYEELLSSGITLLVIGSSFLIFRLATNLKISKRLGLDDCEFACNTHIDWRS